MNLTRKNAFSLIEVVIALGIFSFAMVGIFALIPVSMNSIRSVSNEIRANEIAQTIFGIWDIAPSEMRTNAIDAIPISGLTTTNVDGVTNFCIGVSQTVYCGDDGYLTRNNNKATMAIQYAVENYTDNDDEFKRVKLTFSWPPTAETTSPLYRKVIFENAFIVEKAFIVDDE